MRQKILIGIVFFLSIGMFTYQASANFLTSDIGILIPISGKYKPVLIPDSLNSTINNITNITNITNNYYNQTDDIWVNETGDTMTGALINKVSLNSSDWRNVSITESQVSDLSHTIDTDTDTTCANETGCQLAYTNISNPIWVNKTGDVMTGTLQITGQSVPTTGKGLELRNTADVGTILGYDRDGATYLPIEMKASNYTLEEDGTDRLKLSSGALSLLTANAGHTVAGGFQITGTPAYTTGKGGELAWISDAVGFRTISYDRDTATYYPVYLQGSKVIINEEGNVRFTFDGNNLQLHNGILNVDGTGVNDFEGDMSVNKHISIGTGINSDSVFWQNEGMTGNANLQNFMGVAGTLSTSGNTYNSIGRGFQGLYVSPITTQPITNYNGIYVIPQVNSGSASYTQITGIQAYPFYSYNTGMSVTTSRTLWAKQNPYNDPGTWTTHVGLEIEEETGATTNIGIRSGDPIWVDGDNEGLFLGEGQDFELDYNGSDAIINPKAVGSGDLYIEGGAIIKTSLNVDTINKRSETSYTSVRMPDGLTTKFSTNDVSDPPTEAQLNTAFGSAASQSSGPGFIGIIDDAGAGTDVWLVVTGSDGGSGADWYYIQMTEAT